MRAPARATQAPNRVLLYKPRSLAELERHDGGRRDAVQLGRAIGNLPPGLARAAFVAFPPTFFGYEATPPPAFVRFQVRVRTSVHGSLEVHVAVVPRLQIIRVLLVSYSSLAS